MDGVQTWKHALHPLKPAVWRAGLPVQGSLSSAESCCAGRAARLHAHHEIEGAAAHQVVSPHE